MVKTAFNFSDLWTLGLNTICYALDFVQFPFGSVFLSPREISVDFKRWRFMKLKRRHEINCKEQNTKG